MIRRARERLAAEDGIALTVAVLAVVLIAIVSAVLAGAAAQLSDTTGRGRDDKRAFAAAQAGLNAAFHRLNLKKNTNVPNLLDLTKLQIHVQCLGGDLVPLAGGICPSVADPTMAQAVNVSVGTGTRYSYAVSPMLQQPSCGSAYLTTSNALLNQAAALISNVLAGLSGTPGQEDPLFLYRCITATGETLGPAGNVVARARVQESVAIPFGMVANVVGDDGDPATPDVVVDNGTISRPAGGLVSATAGIVGTNSRVRIRNGGRIDTDVATPAPATTAARIDNQGGTFTGTVRERATPWRMNPVGVGDSRTDNDNGLLLCTLSCSYDASRRTLRIRSLLGLTGSATLKPGIHNYCKIDIDGGLLTNTVVMTSARVFIDPTNCSGVTDAGTVKIHNAQVVALDAVDQYTGIYVSGRPPSGVPGVQMSGGLVVKAAVYAPETEIDVNGAPVQGALYGKKVTFRNSATFLGLLGDVRINLLGAIQTAYVRSGFRQCRARAFDPNDHTCQ